MSACCPHCRAPLSPVVPLPILDVVAGGRVARLSRAQGVLLTALTDAGGQGIGRADLRAALAAVFPRSGPSDVDVHLRRLRLKLRPLGVGVVPVPGSRGGPHGAHLYVLDAPVRVMADGEGDGPAGLDPEGAS